jgi:hypothetical protein
VSDDKNGKYDVLWEENHEKNSSSIDESVVSDWLTDVFIPFYYNSILIF